VNQSELLATTITENPGDASVMIKIFNQPVLLQSAADTTSQGLITDVNS
jgi:hypothetical protein